MLTVYRRPGWFGMLTRIKVVVDDEYGFSLSNGETKQVPILPNSKEVVIECRCQLSFNSRFIVKNPSNVKQVNLKLGFAGFICVVEYKNGSSVDLISKHATSGFNWR